MGWIPARGPDDPPKADRLPSAGRGYSVGSRRFLFCLGWWGGGWRWKTAPGLCPCCAIQRGFGRPRGWYATGPLPHVLDCCTDSTGAGGPARLLHVGWLYCVRVA